MKGARELAIKLWHSGWLPKQPFAGLGPNPVPPAPWRSPLGELLMPVREPTEVLTGRELPPESN